MNNFLLLFLTKQVSERRKVYGKIVTFQKKERAFTTWLGGETFAEIGTTAGVAEATAQIYVIDMIANGVKRKDLHERLSRELEIQDECLEKLHDLLCGRGVPLRELRDTTQLSYNQIWADIALFMNGYKL